MRYATSARMTATTIPGWGSKSSRHEAGKYRQIRGRNDPRSARRQIYKATMKITPDGQTLVVRGYLGIELLGQNQYWTRLPDSAYSMLDPSINPTRGEYHSGRQTPAGAA